MYNIVQPKVLIKYKDPLFICRQNSLSPLLEQNDTTYKTTCDLVVSYAPTHGTEKLALLSLCVTITLNRFRGVLDFSLCI